MVHFSRPSVAPANRETLIAHYARLRTLEDAAGAAGLAVRDDEEFRASAPATAETATLTARYAAALAAVEENL